MPDIVVKSIKETFFFVLLLSIVNTVYLSPKKYNDFSNAFCTLNFDLKKAEKKIDIKKLYSLCRPL